MLLELFMPGCCDEHSDTSVQRVRFPGLLPAPLLRKRVVRTLFVHEFFPIALFPQASGHAAHASQGIDTRNGCMAHRSGVTKLRLWPYAISNHGESLEHQRTVAKCVCDYSLSMLRHAEVPTHLFVAASTP